MNANLLSGIISAAALIAVASLEWLRGRSHNRAETESITVTTITDVLEAVKDHNEDLEREMAEQKADCIRRIDMLQEHVDKCDADRDELQAQIDELRQGGA